MLVLLGASIKLNMSSHEVIEAFEVRPQLQTEVLLNEFLRLFDVFLPLFGCLAQIVELLVQIFHLVYILLLSLLFFILEQFSAINELPTSPFSIFFVTMLRHQIAITEHEELIVGLQHNVLWWVKPDERLCSLVFLRTWISILCWRPVSC